MPKLAVLHIYRSPNEAIWTSVKGADSKQEFYDVCDEKKSDKKGPSAAEKIKIKKSKKKIVSSAD